MYTPILEGEEGKEDSFPIQAMAGTLGIVMLIVAVWFLKNNSDLTGLTAFLAESIKLETGILTVFVVAAKFTARNNYTKRVKTILVKLLGWSAIMVALYALYLVWKRDNNACVTDPVKVHQLFIAVDEREGAYLKELRQVSYNSAYDSAIATAQDYRKTVLKQVIDEAHISDYCKSSYTAAIDSIHEDGLFKYCQRLESLIHLTKEMNDMAEKGDVSAVEPFLLKWNIDPQAFVLNIPTKKDQPFSWSTGIRGYLKHIIDQHVPVRLRPIWKADRCSNDNMGEALEFLII